MLKIANPLIVLLLTSCAIESPERMISSTIQQPPLVDCYCCTWMPGTSYPNGTVACAHGTTSTSVCDAIPEPGADWPEWAPAEISCETDNPWGKP